MGEKGANLALKRSGELAQRGDGVRLLSPPAHPTNEQQRCEGDTRDNGRVACSFRYPVGKLIQDGMHDLQAGCGHD
jgi:hypothetical protein